MDMLMEKFLQDARFNYPYALAYDKETETSTWEMLKITVFEK